MTVRLSGELTPQARRTLSALEDALLSHPQESHIIVATVNCKQVTTISRNDRTDITAGIVDLEVCHYGTPEWKAAGALMNQAREKRTGEVPLPLDT